ncbi:MAG: spore cortex biosynthesis protein YabQ [Ruminococcus sp.]|nr:spore cortex biosynthesis protein YabQ [Ruminococcus sp.]
MVPMQLGVTAEIDVLKNAVIAGVAMGVIYDLFRIIRRTLGREAVTFVCDLLFTLMFSAAFFTVSLALTDYLRGFVLIGMLAGAAMWCLTVGRAVTWLVTAVLQFISGKIVVPVIVCVYKICKHIYTKIVGNTINLRNVKKISQST